MRAGNRSKRSKSRSKRQGGDSYLIMGRNALLEVLKSCPDRLRQVYVSESSGDGRKDKILKRIKEAGKSFEVVEKESLYELTNSESHQGFVAELDPPAYMDVDSFLRGVGGSESCLMLAVDSVEDAQNLGAIYRAAECFGVDALLLPERRTVALNAVVSKVSVGATELVSTVKTKNLVQSLARLKKAGFWVVSADLAADSIPIDEYEVPDKIVIVVGSEGKGVRPGVTKEVDVKVRIPMQGKIDSLNVSQATAVMLYSLSR